MATPIYIYATLADFRDTGLPSTALSGTDDSVINAALANASDMVSDSFSSQFTLPMLQIGNSVKQHTINIAAMIILDSIGDAAEGKSYETWQKKYILTQEWLRQVREREIHPAQCIDSGSPTNIQPGPQATPLISAWNPGNFCG